VVGLLVYGLLPIPREVANDGGQPDPADRRRSPRASAVGLGSSSSCSAQPPGGRFIARRDGGGGGRMYLLAFGAAKASASRWWKVSVVGC